jgi:hypothetical protein
MSRKNNFKDMNNTFNVIYTLNRDGSLTPDTISVPSNLTANIYINNNWNQPVVAQFAGTPEANCPAGKITLLFTMDGGNPGLIDFINITSPRLSSSLIWE